MKAVLYLRYSSASQTEQSIEGQRTVCRKFAESKDIDIVGEYVDRATSASHDLDKRTSFQKMLVDSSKKTFDAVIVYKLDRFSRDRYESATSKKRLKDNGVTLMSATEPIGDGPESIIVESMLEGLAEYYSAELSQKIRRGINESIQKRNFLGGPVPVGFKVEDQKLVPDPVTAPVVKRAFEMVVDGKTYKEIAKYVEKQGLRNSRGKPFGYNALTKIFHSKRYNGYYVYKDIEVPNTINKIVDDDLFEKVQERLRMTRSRKHDTNYLLTGKLFCGHCGSKMTGTSGKSKSGDLYYYYACAGRKKGCSKKTVKKDAIEAFVAQKALDMLTDEVVEKIVSMVMDEYEKAKGNSPLDELRDDIKDLDRQINNGLQAVLNGFSNPALQSKIDELTTQKRQLEERLEELKDTELFLEPDMVRFYLHKLKTRAIKSEDSDKRIIQTFVQKVILFDDPDGSTKIQIIFNLSDYSSESTKMFDLHSPSSTIMDQSEHFRVSLDAMVVIVCYTVQF